MNTKLIAVVLFVTTSSFGQTPSVLIEACNAIADSERRLVCFKAVIEVNNSKPNAPDAKEVAIQAVEKAFIRMQSNLGVGISYNNYQTALLDLASPLGELRRVGGTELPSEGMALIDQALETYADAAKFWHAAISFYARRDNELAYFRGLPIGLTRMDWLVTKYQLATVNADLLGFHRGLQVDSTRARLWAIAAEISSKGISLLRGIDSGQQHRVNKDNSVSPFIEHDGITWTRPVDADVTTSYTSQSKRVVFGVPSDTPVKAVAPGIVVFAGNKLIGYVNLIIIKHDDRYLTAYYENSRIHVIEGDAVKQGQIIAGSSNNLSFEVRLRGNAVDPSAYLPPR